MSFKVSDANEYFDRLDERFDAAGAKGVDAIFQWDLGETGVWHAEVKDGTMTLHKGAHDAPTTTITMKGPNYVKMVNGDLNGQMAFMTGKMKIKGNIPMAMKLKNIFPQVG